MRTFKARDGGRQLGAAKFVKFRMDLEKWLSCQPSRRREAKYCPVTAPLQQ